MDREFDMITLPNGIRVIHKQVVHTKVAHCSIMMDIGSRDEQNGEEGLAHFWEHMAFKGTQKRKAYHIINRLEILGGELNAYTTKEKICFYASILDTHLEKAVELLADITFNSVFPEKQIEKERGVILEEMAMYQDSPEDAIQDEFDELIFDGHALGINILGNQQTVSNFHQTDFLKFVAENMDSSRLIFCSVGPSSLAKVKKLANRHLKEVPSKSSSRSRVKVNGYTPKQEVRRKTILQAHCAIGNRSFAVGDNKRVPFSMLVNILGGPAMNSRLNLALREKKGYVYSIESGYAAYGDTGLFSIFFGTEPAKINRCKAAVYKELKLLRDKRLGNLQLHAAKEQIIGQLAMSEENNSHLMLTLAKSMLDLNRVDTLEAIFERIRAVTASELSELANEIFCEEELSVLTFLPSED